MKRWLCLLLLLPAPLLIGCPVSVPPGNTNPGATTNKPTTTPTPRPTGQSTASTKPSTAPVATPKPTGPAPVVTVIEEPGLIRGVVKWEGAAVPPPWDATGLTAVGLGGKKSPAELEPRIKIDPTTKGIQYAVIWLDIPAAKVRPKPPEVTPSLVQRDGDFRPQVLALRKGTNLNLVCADDRAVFHATGAEDWTETVTTKQATRTLNKEGLLTITSDLDKWMRSYVHVFPHDSFAVTGPTGEFRLSAVSSGKYKLMLWIAGWELDDKATFTPKPPVMAEAEVEITIGKGALVVWTLPGGNK